MTRFSTQEKHRIAAFITLVNTSIAHCNIRTNDKKEKDLCSCSSIALPCAHLTARDLHYYHSEWSLCVNVILSYFFFIFLSYYLYYLHDRCHVITVVTMV
jgi:hypothetical protein